MNGAVLLIPFLLIRFVLLSALNPKAIRRAAYFAPMRGKERIAYYIYQISNLGIFVYLFFLRVEIDLTWLFCFGAVCYLAGLCFCAMSIVSFSLPDDKGMNTDGIYRFSRNPMYVSYFICFLGMALLTQSLILFAAVMIFQASGHWIILSEERWCVETFGERYLQYMKRTRRYL